jgi:acetyl esterase/lipase
MFQGSMRRLAWGYGSAVVIDDLPADPEHVLLSAWDNGGHGVWRADINTGRVSRVADGTWDTADYFTDGHGAPVIRIDALSGGRGYRILRRAPGARAWSLLRDVRRTEASTLNSPDFQAIAPGPGDGRVYVIARPDQSDLAALYLFDTTTGELGAPVQQGRGADVDEPWINRATRELLATCEEDERLACRAQDHAMQRHLDAIDAFFDHNARVVLVDMSADATKWLLFVTGPTEPGDYFLYDASAAHMTPIASMFPDVDRAGLSPTTVVRYQSHDGTALWAYVTARPGAGPRPMVLMPHGGPEARDHFGYDPLVQLLASRGYVVVQPNFRGSGGFGRAFADAGRGQWGLRMQDDLTDAVRHMIATGAADPARICIVGHSYGGYAALAGATLTPELYRCVVASAGVSDLVEMMHNEHDEAGSISIHYQYWRDTIGDLNADRAALVAASPARMAERVKAPVLLIHGETDETVPIRQSELMDEALRRAGHPARFVRIADADHYFYTNWTREQRRTLFSEIDAFLAQNLR